jgi:organic radical activating enzyme
VKASRFAAERDVAWHVRRGIGFTIKARIAGSAARVIVKRHGQERAVELSQDELRALMRLDRFTPVEDRPLCERFEAMDFRHRFLQPMDGPAREANTSAALRYCLDHPRWRLSLQTHKLLGIP